MAAAGRPHGRPPGGGPAARPVCKYTTDLRTPMDELVGTSNIQWMRWWDTGLQWMSWWEHRPPMDKLVVT